MLVHTEVVLERDGGQGTALLLDIDSLFGFDGLVQAVREAATVHHATSVFVHDDDLAVFDHVIAVALKERGGFQGLLDVVDGFIAFLIEVFDSQALLEAADTIVGESGGFEFFVHVVVGIFGERGDHFGKLGIFGGGRYLEIMSGVRASSIKMESTSSTIA
jgi:hypothetical protein